MGLVAVGVVEAVVVPNGPAVVEAESKDEKRQRRRTLGAQTQIRCPRRCLE